MVSDEKQVLLSEYTPLLNASAVSDDAATRLRRRSLRHHRYPYKDSRGLCKILLAGVFFVTACFAILVIINPELRKGLTSGRGCNGYAPWNVIYPSSSWPESDGVSYEDLQQILLETPDESRIREYSKYYTSGPHLAGKNISQAIYTRDLWRELGVPNSHLNAYDIYINYPKGHRLALLESKSDDEEPAVKYEASLEEDVLEEDPTSGASDRVPTFHGYSASGNVTAQYVFANYGTVHDFNDVLKANVSLEGKIALVKYGHIFRGLKVKRAQELGMVGIVMYTDPGDDGETTEKNGFKEYPEGPARNPSSVQRGSTNFLSFLPGDPTTPGYPSLPGAPRVDPHDFIPSIPSIPISYKDALPLLQALNGHGPEAISFNKWWQTGGLGHKGVNYNVGPSPPSLTLNLINEQEYVTNPIWNVIGIINGTIPDEVIIMGNHRDAWIAGGAGDPNSGSASFNEVIRGLGLALKAGWKPLRTIVLASWDGEEYGLIGSTEWVEEYLPWLSSSAVAYINVDVAAVGPIFEAAGAPLLDKVLISSTQLIPSPNQTTPNQTLFDVWSKKISTMGSGSDFTAFQDFAGIPCVNLGFGGAKDSPVYHYHSNYDSFAWMDRYGDPGFLYHAAMARLWGQLALKLIESPILPLNATDYARALARYVDTIDVAINATSSNLPASSRSHLSVAKLHTAVAHLHNASLALDAASTSLTTLLTSPSTRASITPWYRYRTKQSLFARARAINKRYQFLERKFLHPEGLDGRGWFKHTIFAPGRWTGYAGAVFPGLVEALEDADVGGFWRWVGVVEGRVWEAAGSLGL